MQTPTVYNTLDYEGSAFERWAGSPQKYNIEQNNIALMRMLIANNFFGKRNARIRKYGQAENHTLGEY